jgi:uncharacterized protein
MQFTRDRPFQSLALAGGGYRGLFTARALEVLEEQSGVPIGRRFDLISGTSIGGIVALAVAFEIPMSKVVSTFSARGAEIFPSSMYSRTGQFFRKWVRPRYASAALREVIDELLPSSLTLRDAKHPVAIPAVNVTQARPQVFKTRHHENWIRDLKLPVQGVALATSAAPTFFPLAEVDGHFYVDGGLFANAPDLIAIHEAETFFDVGMDAMRVLSIGTTTQSYSLSFENGRQYGIADWMRQNRLFSITISAQQQFFEQIARHRLGDRYLRIDSEPSAEQAEDLGLDVATPAATKTLSALGAKAATDAFGPRMQAFLQHVPQLQVMRDL